MAPTLTLHGSPMSTCTRRVLTTLYALGLKEGEDFTMAALQDRADIKKAPWLENQPFGQMPYLVDGDISLYESRAICKYLAAKFNSPLMPPSTDLKAYAAFEIACSVESFNFDPFVAQISYEKVFKARRGLGGPDEAKVKALRDMLALRLKGYETILGKTKYVAGDKLTLADIFHLPYGAFAEGLGDVPEFTDGSSPNVQRWWKELTELEAWKQANP